MDPFGRSAKNNVLGVKSLTIAVTATFTAEPVEASLRFWMQKLGTRTQIAFAPYNQVFQQLLDPSSMLATNQNGVNVVLVRFEDWRGRNSEIQEGVDESTDPCDEIERNVRHFIGALIAAIERRPTSYLVYLCPSSPSMSVDPRLRSFFRVMEDLIVSELGDADSVDVVTTAQLASVYPVTAYYDRQADKLAGIPYAPIFYTALGTMIARRLFALKSPPYKVVVLDCDETLWNGVCGEDGAKGVQIDPIRKAFQEFMVRQHGRGMLICLCSKNNEEDVLEVFRCRNDMVLTRDDITAWRVNWRPKSENLQSLSRELGLGLDSFILIDDDPVECAEVQERCPEVLTLQLPKEPDFIPRFLKHVWAFDHGKITEEDRQRTALYQQHIMREHIRLESLTLKDFLANLNLEVHISPLNEGEIGRVSELTLRTNQFNLTTVRRTEAEIRELCRSAGAECLVVHVKDRFGDYGLVGVIILKVHVASLIVDTFLLSCRALGRGVEHKMLARLGEIAKQRGVGRLDLRCIPSNKNRPALDFLESLGEAVKEDSDTGFLFSFAADCAASVSYNPEVKSPGNDPDAGEVGSPAPDPRPTADSRTRADLLRSIPEMLYDAELIHRLAFQNQMRPDFNTTFVRPYIAVEKEVAQIYSELLGIDEIGINDGFFELGGHSLLAMQVLSRVQEVFEVELSPRLLFTGNFTVAELTQAIQKEQMRRPDGHETAMTLKKLSELTTTKHRSF